MIYLEPRKVFDPFIVGTAEGFNLEENCLIYSKTKIINHLIASFELNPSHEEKMEMALEYFDYNILGMYVGPTTPIFLEDFYSNVEEEYV